MKSIFYIGLLIFITITGSKAEQVDTMRITLTQAIEFAIENNPNVENAKLDVLASEKRIWETTSIGLPQVGANAGYTNNLRLTTTLIPRSFIDPEAGVDEFMEVKFGTQHNANLNLDVTQLVFSGPYIVGLQASRIYKSLSERSLENVEIETREIIARTYYTILLSEETRSVLKSNLENLNKTLLETRALYNSGFAEEIDVDQVIIMVHDLENMVISNERTIDMLYKTLKYQMGLDLSIPVTLSDNLARIMGGLNTELLLTEEFNLTDHIQYRLMDTQEKLAYLNLRREQSEYLPSVSAFYTYQELAMRDEFNMFSTSGDWYNSSMIGINFSIPIFTSGHRRALVSQRKIELEQAKNNKQYVSQGLELEYQEARDDFKNAMDKTAREEKNIALAEKIFERTSIKYQAGMATSLELLQANNQYLNSETNLTIAKIELLNAKIRLDKALNNL